MYTDASDSGAGAVLTQVQKGEMRVIAYASLAFSDAEKGYSVLERELAALRWGVKSFRGFLFGVHFIAHVDHMPLLYLHNMKIICSRLERTRRELEEYDMEIKYTPGKLNICADAFSRVFPEGNSMLELTGEDTEGLPEGFEIEGEAVPGGGNSLFISLLRCLHRLEKTAPQDHQELRCKLISDLLNNACTYKLKLNKEKRRQLKSMLYSNRLPCFEVMLAASRLYNISINVFFWNKDPVVYKYQKKDNMVLHDVYLQCLAGIHFNPLRVEKTAGRNSVLLSSVVQVSAPHSKKKWPCGVPKQSEELEEMGIKSLFRGSDSEFCSHKKLKQPCIRFTVNNKRCCALVDSGSEISLVTEDVIDMIASATKVEKYKTELVGLTGRNFIADKRVKLEISLMDHKTMGEFVVVPDRLIPSCFLLGARFLEENDVVVDFAAGVCKMNSHIVAHVLMNNTIGEELMDREKRFDERIKSPKMTELMSENNIRYVQNKVRHLKNLKKHILEEKPKEEMCRTIRFYKRYLKDFLLKDDILMIKNIRDITVPVVTCLLYTSPSPRDKRQSRMPSSA